MACGSGIFLRTTLESQIADFADGANLDVKKAVSKAVSNVYAVDIDPNACAATVLSLSALHLVATDKFPRNLRVINDEATEHFSKHEELANSFDAFIVNPPFIRTEQQSNETRKTIAEFLSGIAKGRLDAYAPFLRIGLDVLKPGGYGMFVLPQSFLVSESSKGLRRWLHEHAWILSIADLSAVRVFEDVSVYPILLILQKKSSIYQSEPPCTFIRWRSYTGSAVGRGLQDYLDGVKTESPSHTIFDVNQSELDRDEWTPPPPTFVSIAQKLRSFISLSDVAVVRQGVVTGADNVFIRNRTAIPKGEESAYVPYLPDEDMTKFRLPTDTEFRLFYPFDGNRKLLQDELQERFPETWDYIVSNRERLSARAPVKRKDKQWWELAWPRDPKKLLGPKVVTPHVSLLPRFGVDEVGRWAVGRTALITPRQPENTSKQLGRDLLYYLAGILNSSVSAWHLDLVSRKYRSGYNRLEGVTLKQIPIPSPTEVEIRLFGNIVDIVAKIMMAKDETEFVDLQRILDGYVFDLYGLTEAERARLVK